MDWEHDGRPRWHFNEWHGLAAMFAVTLALLLLISCGEQPRAVWHPAPTPTPTVVK
jgi:hypothetical protein